MRIFLISDNSDTLVGMQLAGVPGIVVNDKHELRHALDDVVEKKDVGILLVTEKLARMMPERVAQIKLGHGVPILVEIPDRHGTTRSPDSITRRVKEAIGVKI